MIERLCWPIRMVRWRVAQEFGALLSSKQYGKLALLVYLEWLSGRGLESEVVSGLSVLKCVSKDFLPPLNKLCAHINAPSILTDAILQSTYGYGTKCGGWSGAHSGRAPPSFEPAAFFLKYNKSHVPPILGDVLDYLYERFGVNLPRQWAFEWQALMDRTNSPYSGYPYYFIDGSYRETGVFGQFSQRQDDVYRSAYLRTIAYAVSTGMPMDYATWLASHTLTLNNDFANLKPGRRPEWLDTLPEQCCVEGADVELLCQALIQRARINCGSVPISIKIPISPEVEKFADLRIRALLVSSDFSSNIAPDLSDVGAERWSLDESSSFNRILPKTRIEKHLVRGVTGTCVPVGLTVFPDSSGFWHNDYFSTGIILPASYALPATGVVVCDDKAISVDVDGSSVSRWTVWHDHWSPLYAEGGSARCGMLTTMSNASVVAAAKALGRSVGWIAQLRVWKPEKEHGKLILSDKAWFFPDIPAPN